MLTFDPITLAGLWILLVGLVLWLVSEFRRPKRT